MDTPTLIQGAITIGVGAISGGITNAVAIWMLFHPYEPRGLGRLRIQGAIPKNKARLAKSIGRTVGERLLTPEDLAQRLSAPAVRRAFDDAMSTILDAVLDRERGALRQQLRPELAEALDEAVASLAPRVAERVAAYARSPDFERMVTGWLGGARTDGNELERALRRFVTTQLDQLACDERPLIERLPPEVIRALEHAITDYLPVALERAAALLADPEARVMIEDALRTAFDHSVRDLLLHERILAKLVVTDRTIERLVDGFEREGIDRFADAIAEPEMKAQMTRAVREAVANFLHLPMAERLRRMTPARRERLAMTLGDWLVRIAQADTTRDALARVAADVLDDERGRRWIGESVTQVANRLLARPIGRPAEWLGPETTAAIRAGLTDAAWGWVQAQIPRVVEHIHVPEMVEQKVLGFSTQRMEEIVRNVTQRELDLIVRLGYVLGGVVGMLAFLINLAFA